jgi:hypothetical protein
VIQSDLLEITRPKIEPDVNYALAEVLLSLKTGIGKA